ncbi:MAG: phage terminase large subunit [Kofleriaceae bacterium]
MTMTLPAGWRENPTLAAEVLETLREAKRARSGRTFDSPGELAAALDPETVQTPALDLIDAALVSVAKGETDRLIISMPPQEGKSERTTHYGALWLLMQNPSLRLAIVSYADDIAAFHSTKIRNDIITFDGSDENVDLGLRLQPGSNAASRWSLARTTKRPKPGGLIARGIGAALTGRPVDVLLIDDPVKDFRAADSELQSEQSWQWWMSVARPRLRPGAPVILILTRWSEKDLAGRLLAKQADDEQSGAEHFDRWTVVNIPAQAQHDPAKGETDPLGREPGEFMISARGRSQAQWQATKVATEPRAWTALYQGRPSPDIGNVWQRPWWRRFDAAMHSVAEGGTGAFRVKCDELIASWDMTFKETAGTDYVVGQVWARRGADVYLLDQVRRRMSFTETVAAVEAQKRRWPQLSAVLIEDKANGPAVIAQLRSKIPGLIAVEPDGSKFARANAVSPFVQAGNVWLPTKEVALMVDAGFDPEELIDEAAAFPNGAHDDTVDATSQALSRMLLDGTGAAAWLAWLQRRIEAGGTIREDGAPTDVDPQQSDPELVATPADSSTPLAPPAELTDEERLHAARDAAHRARTGR